MVGFAALFGQCSFSLALMHWTNRLMNLIWLEDFLALAATGNFSRAAEDRHSSQPAFSRRIRALEEWLGAELFDRSTQPAQLTEVGEWFRRRGAGTDRAGGPRSRETRGGSPRQVR